MQHKNLWDRLDTPTKVVAGLVGIAVTLVTAWLTLVGNPLAPSPAEQEAATNPAAVAARQVDHCLSKHRMKSPRVTVGEPARQLRFLRCDWPPLTDTSTDGYSQIVDHVTPVPGRVGADLYDAVDRFVLPCDDARVTYVLAQTGTREFVARLVSSGRLYLVTSEIGTSPTATPRLTIKQLNYTPGDVERFVPAPSNARDVYVLHSGHFQPFDAVCTAAQK